MTAVRCLLAGLIICGSAAPAAAEPEPPLPVRGPTYREDGRPLLERGKPGKWTPERWRPEDLRPERWGESGSERSDFAVKVAAGLVSRWAFDETFLSGVVDIQLGGRIRAFSVGGRLTVQAGRTQAGLVFGGCHVGPWMDLELHRRVRVGLGLHIGSLMIRRRSNVSNSQEIFPPVLLVAFGGGLTLGVDVDLWQEDSGRSGLFLGLRPGIEGVQTIGLQPATLFLTGLLGFRR